MRLSSWPFAQSWVYRRWLLAREMPGLPQRKAIHLVNFGYDEVADIVVSSNNKVFAFDASGSYIAPKVTYFILSSPDGVRLPVTSLGSGDRQVTIPTLLVYGIVVVEEG